MKKIAVSSIFLLFFLSTLGAEEITYTNNSFARLSYVTGNSYVQRASELTYEESIVNMPISEGDRIGTTDGRVEIYLGKGNYIRLDNNTKLDFLNLPKKGDDLIQVRLWSGNIYLSVYNLEKEKTIEIHSSDVSTYILNVGLYRFDVRENAETEIFVFEGLVEAAGESGSALIKEAHRLEVINGHFTSQPTRFMAVADDSFDMWSENRESEARKHMANAYLPEELEDFENELDANGEWTYIPPYGYVWVPGGVGVNWRPYYNGRWIMTPLAGWTWLPYEPWGWATYHYGRWHWGVGLGWYWIPTSIWGPGWVSWYYGYDYYGWAPLSYYGYPGYLYNNMYYSRHTGYYPYNSRALTVIHKNQLKARNVSKVALTQDSIKKLGKISMTNKGPNIKLTKSEIAVQKLEGKKVFLHNKESAVQFKEMKHTSISNYGKIKTEGSVQVKKSTVRNLKPSNERNILKKKTGYPSSPNISIKKYSGLSRTRKSRSTLGRLYNYISGGSSKYIKSSSSRTSSSKKVSSSSSSRSRTSSSTGRSSSSRTRSSSSSSKTKKKK